MLARRLLIGQEMPKALWLDASDSATLSAVDGYASHVLDKSGRGLVFYQTTAVSRPSVGVNKITFSSVNRYMQCDTSIQADASGVLYVFCVLSRSGGYGGNVFVERKTGRFASFSSTYIPGDGKYYLYSDGVNVSSNATMSSSSYGLTDGLNQVLWVHSPGSRMRMFINSIEVPVLTGTSTTLSGAAGAFLGYNGSSWAGDVHEIIAYAETPVSDVIQETQGRLAHKWDSLLGVTTLVGKLPLSHPYKYIAP